MGLQGQLTNCKRRAARETAFHDMALEGPRNEMKTVTHVYAQSVTHVCSLCRERGEGGGEPPDVGSLEASRCPHVSPSPRLLSPFSLLLLGRCVCFQGNRDGGRDIGFPVLLRFDAELSTGEFIDKTEVIEETGQKADGDDGEDEFGQGGGRFGVAHSMGGLRPWRQRGNGGEGAAEGDIHFYTAVDG